MPSDHAALRRLAEAATQGPWTTEHGDLPIPPERNSVLRHDDHPAHDGCSGTRTICESQDSLDSSGTNPNLEYIAAASPTVILTLLDEIARLEGVAEAARRWSDHPDRGLTRHMTEEGAALRNALDALDAAPLTRSPPPMTAPDPSGPRRMAMSGTADPAVFAARLEEIRANHACADAAWQAWVEQGYVKPAPPTCSVCGVLSAYDALAGALRALDWALPFVKEPDCFPNPGDAQLWKEHLEKIVALARAGRRE